MEFPRYKCHKEVSAVKIAAVELGADGTLHLQLEDGFDTVVISAHDRKFKAKPEKGWYLVRYDGGYLSFSPAQAFEEGYTLISGTEPDGSGTEKYGGRSAWTEVGYTKDGFPCEKGAPEDVSGAGDDSADELAALKQAGGNNENAEAGK